MISKEAHEFLVSQKRVDEEPFHKVLDRLLDIPKEVKP